MRFLGFFPRSLMFNGIFRILKGFLRFIQDFRDLWGFFLGIRLYILLRFKTGLFTGLILYLKHSNNIHIQQFFTVVISE